MTRLVLASASPRRRALLTSAGRPPDAVTPAHVDETPGTRETAEALVHRLATAKRDAVAASVIGDDDVVLAADTVVALDDEVLGKPTDDDHAARMLRALAGRVAVVLSGVAVGGGDGSNRDAVVVGTQVSIRPLTDDEITTYVRTGEPRGAAGAFRLQGAGAALVGATDGCLTNVVGLPVCETRDLLAARGVHLDAVPCERVLADLRRGPSS